MTAPRNRAVKVECPLPHHVAGSQTSTCACCGEWLSKDARTIVVTLGLLESARLVHSEACEAELVAWDAYNAELERRGIDSDLHSVSYRGYVAAARVRERALDEVRRVMASSRSVTEVGNG